MPERLSLYGHDLRPAFSPDGAGSGSGLPQPEQPQEHSLLSQHMIKELGQLGFTHPEVVEATASFFDTLSQESCVSAVGVVSRKPFGFAPPVLDISILIPSADEERDVIESIDRLCESFQRNVFGFFDTTFVHNRTKEYSTPEEFQLMLKQDAKDAREGKVLMHARLGEPGTWELYEQAGAKSHDWFPGLPADIKQGLIDIADTEQSRRVDLLGRQEAVADARSATEAEEKQPPSAEKVVDSKVGSFTDRMIALLNLPDDEFNLAMDLLPEFGVHATPLRNALIGTLYRLREVYRDNKDPNRPKIFGDVQDSRGFTRPTLSERRRRIGNAPLSDPQDIDPL